MKIMDFLDPQAIKLEMNARKKREALEELVDLLVERGEVGNKKEVLEALSEREKLGSTGIGNGIAIPHAKCPSVRRLVVAFGCSRRGVDFDCLDGKPAHIFFLLLGPPGEPGPHLKALARLSRMLKESSFRRRLGGARDLEEVEEAIREVDI